MPPPPQQGGAPPPGTPQHEGAPPPGHAGASSPGSTPDYNRQPGAPPAQPMNQPRKLN